jgi:hypothetical protein
MIRVGIMNIRHLTLELGSFAICLWLYFLESRMN